MMEARSRGDAVSTDNTCLDYKTDDFFLYDLCLTVFKSQKILGINLPFLRLRGGRRSVNFPTFAVLSLSLLVSFLNQVYCLHMSYL